MAIDTSTSMSCAPETVAKAVALYFTARARMQNRVCYLINFSTGIETLDLSSEIGLVTDYVKGNYKDVPWNVIAAVTGAVIYFVSPVDVIPDVIPVVGYIDDALVVKLALEIARPDLEAYARWKAA